MAFVVLLLDQGAPPDDEAMDPLALRTNCPRHGFLGVLMVQTGSNWAAEERDYPTNGTADRNTVMRQQARAIGAWVPQRPLR